ncbi:MAG: hypothetical protein J1E02_08965, partial [Coprobacter sp.]|nr:hypothetical protein [Coprobacter sp.]
MKMRIQLFLFLALIGINWASDTYIYRRVIKIWFNRRWMKRGFWTANLLVFIGVMLSLYAVRTGYAEQYDYLLFWFFFVY